MNTSTRVLLLAAMLLLLAGMSAAQITNPQNATVSLNATMREQFSFQVTGATLDWANLQPGAANASDDTITVTTRYLLDRTRTSVDVFGYFDTADALTDGTNTIANTAVSLIIDSAAGPAFTSTINTMPNAAQIDHKVLATDGYNTWGAGLSLTHTIGLSLDLTSTPQLPAGTYTGTLHLRAQVI